MLRARGSGILISLVLVACSRPRPQGEALPPLSGTSWLSEVGPQGARVSVPLGATQARPVIIALHGDGDRPEWACGSYRHLSANRAFVLCPAGQATSSERFRVLPLAESQRRLREDLLGLKGRFGKYIAPGPVVLAAIGAAVPQAIEIALQEPAFFAYLLLIDGSPKYFSAPLLTRFGSAGGRRVLWMCSEEACASELAPRQRALPPAGVEIRWLRSQAGRGLDAAMVQSLTEEFRWLVAGDPRFAPWVSH